jgi:hypothetical protein
VQHVDATAGEWMQTSCRCLERAPSLRLKLLNWSPWSK